MNESTQSHIYHQTLIQFTVALQSFYSKNSADIERYFFNRISEIRDENNYFSDVIFNVLYNINVSDP